MVDEYGSSVGIPGESKQLMDIPHDIKFDVASTSLRWFYPAQLLTVNATDYRYYSALFVMICPFKVPCPNQLGEKYKRISAIAALRTRYQV